MSEQDLDPETAEMMPGVLRTLAACIGRGESLTPERLVRIASTLVPHSAHVGITLTRSGGRAETLAATDALPADLDRLQRRTGEGPCLTASVSDDAVLSDDLRTEGRWPQFAAQCVAQTGVRSILAVRLALSEEDRAALNFYATTEDVFDDNDVVVGSMLAPYVALCVEQTLHRRDVRNLQQAVESNREIGIAIGILMNQFKITREEAFDRLRHTSQQLNRKLREIAADLEFTGQLPQLPAPATRPAPPAPVRVDGQGEPRDRGTSPLH